MNLLFNTGDILLIQSVNRLHKDIIFHIKKPAKSIRRLSYHFS
ncbi:hypothetical protein CHCC14598_4711 [Bacillus licheniformis]|nr:hypothetical protein CHCC14598_4711 [Bacillus licheniformis]